MAFKYDESQLFNEYEKAKEKEVKATFGEGDFLELKPDGEMNIFRFLPPPPSSNLKAPFVVDVIHYFMGEKGKKIALNCTLGNEGACPICSLWEHLRKKAGMEKDQAKKDDLYEQAKAIKPVTNYIWSAMDENNKVGLLTLPIKVHDMIFEQIKTLKTIAEKTRSDYHSIFDLQNGKAVIIKKEKNEKQGGWWEWAYTVTVAPDRSAVPQEIIEKYDELFVSPDKYVKTYTQKELEMAVKGDFSFMKKPDDAAKPASESAAKKEEVKEKAEKRAAKVDDEVEDILNA